MLTSLLLTPIIGLLALAPMQADSPAEQARVKQVALLVTVITFLLSVWIWGEFDRNTSQYQFTAEFNELSFCHLYIGIDGLSLYFVLLTAFTLPLCILASWDNVQRDLKPFMMAFLLVEALLLAVFTVLDLLLFYVFFESVLIPLFLVVGIWGAGSGATGSESRIRASFLLFMYTLFGSLFMLLAFLVMIYNAGTSDLELMSMLDISFPRQKWLWLAIFLSFAIKTPIIPFHLWLIRAHVEAPVAGSIVLAGLVLKLATYGILRVLIPLLPEATAYFSPLAFTLGIISIVYASVSALRQTDFKCLIAYSSIAHMGVTVLGLFSNALAGLEGAILLALGHGFVSPALFYVVGSVLYDRYHTRTIRYYRGLVYYMPVAMTLFFLFTLANMGTPLTVNWVGEFMALAGAYQLNPVATVIGASSIVLSAAFSIWLFNRLAFGASSPYITYTSDLTRREYTVLFALLLPTLIFGLLPNIILNDLHYTVSTLLYA